MEQLAIRDWMIIIGAMMIAAVLLDAVRRYWKERRAEIKLNARIDRSSPLSDDDDAFNLLTELPNGGARIVQRDDLQSDMSAGEVLGSDEPATPRRELEPAAVPVDMGSDVSPRSAPDPIDVAVEALDAADILVRTAAIRALERMTGERLGYDPGAPRTDRTEAIERWVRYVNDSAMTTAHADGEA